MLSVLVLALVEVRVAVVYLWADETGLRILEQQIYVQKELQRRHCWLVQRVEEFVDFYAPSKFGFVN